MEKENANDRNSFNLVKIPLIDKTNKTKLIFDSINKIINNNLNTLISGEWNWKKTNSKYYKCIA